MDESPQTTPLPEFEFPPVPIPRVSWNLSLQQLVGAAERLMERATPGFSEKTDWLTLVEQTRDRLLFDPFTAMPLSGFLKKTNNKERLLAVTHPADRLIEEALLPILVRRFEALAPDSLYAFRKGRGTYTAALAAHRVLMKYETPHLALLDVADFFPSIDREILHQDLLEWAPPRMADIIMSLVSAPVHLHGQTLHQSGIPLGCPLSPVLSNMYLLPVDAVMANELVDYLRYADDLLLIAPNPGILDQAMHVLARALERRKLRLKTEKSQVYCFGENPFTWLGHFIDRSGIFDKVGEKRIATIDEKKKAGEKAAAEAASTAEPSPDAVANEHHRTLYVTGQGIYVSVGEQHIECKKGKEVLRRVPLHRVDRVVYMATGSFSSGFFASCINRRIPIMYWSGKGRGYAVIVPEGNLNPLRLRAQFDLRSDPARRVAIARDILLTKCDSLLHRIGADETHVAQIENIRRMRERMLSATQLASLIGLEGATAVEYFQIFKDRIQNPDFAFTRRSKRPPMDAINSLMSFTYSLLFSEFESTLLFHGLDPHPGFLHELHRQHAALASDLLEPYRALVADTFVLYLVNKKMVEASGFEKQQHGAVYMTPETRKTVLQAYETFMRTPFGGHTSAGTPRQLIYGAVQCMLGVILGEYEKLTLPLHAGECPRVEPYIEVVTDGDHPVPIEFVCEPSSTSPVTIAPSQGLAPPPPTVDHANPPELPPF